MLEQENGLQSLHICKPAEYVKYFPFYSVKYQILLCFGIAQLIVLTQKINTHKPEIFPKQQP